MDANKRDRLHEIGYVIHPSCGLCEHSDFEGSDWGTCRLHSYKHLKHTGPQRSLSIHVCGGCPQFQPSEHTRVVLGGFAEFQQPPQPPRG